MVIGMLPGTVLAAGTGTSALSISPTAPTITAGTSQVFVPAVTGDTTATVLANTTFVITAAANITLPGGTIYATGSPVPGATCNNATGSCTAIYAGAYNVVATNIVDPVGAPTVGTTATAVMTVTATTMASLKVTGLAAAVSAVADPADMTVTAYDTYGNVATGYVGTVYFTSATDPTATLPVAYTFTSGIGLNNGVKVFTHGAAGTKVVFDTPGTQSVTVTDALTLISGTQTGIVVTGTSAVAGTFNTVAATRFLDTRYGVGLTGAFVANTPRTFQIAAFGGIVPLTAIAVTGNLTVTDASNGWAVFLGPTALAAPTTSTINFVKGQTKANNVTVALASDGSLSATFISTAGSTTDLVFDVTGYFMGDTNGLFYNAITPVRAVDTRTSTVPAYPGVAAKLVANQPVCYNLNAAHAATVPGTATAVTGNLTVTGANNGWAVYVGPAAVAAPTTSAINFTAGQTKSNGVTVALGTGDMLCATFISTAGSTVDLVFDVTGYFQPTTGNRFMPIAPVRMLDTRSGVGFTGPLSANTPRSFQVSSGATGAPVPTAATAVSGNFTVTDETNAWAAYLGPLPLVSPTTSNLNFVAGEITSNGLDVGLSGSGTLSATYISNAGNTTNLVLDVTGYFLP
jgi:hypothetical protein